LMGFNDVSAYAPIPSNSLPLPARPDGMILQELGQGSGVWFVSDSAYTSAIIDIGDSVVVVDAPPTYSEQRLKAVVSTVAGNRPVSHFIFSHTHNDHVGLASTFSGATFAAHPITAGLLTRNKKLPKPTLMLNNGTKLTLGNKNLEFYTYENSHEEGSLLIWLPQQKVVIFIDIVFPQWVPFFALGVTQDQLRFVAVHDTLLSYNFEYLVSGHLGRWASRADTQQAKQYLADLGQIITETYALFPFENYYKLFAGPPTHWWGILHNWHGDMATECAKKTIAKYKGVLAGVDVYAWTHCWHLREAMDLFGIGGEKKRSMKEVQRKLLE